MNVAGERLRERGTQIEMETGINNEIEMVSATEESKVGMRG